MYILFPGRHHLVTRFQHEYLRAVISQEPAVWADVNGKPVSPVAITGIIFAVTSSNHSNTRRNPVPFYLRALLLQEFARDLGVPVFIYGIDDLGTVPDFADYTVKRIRHESEGSIDIHPANTLVLCSTPVLEMYEDLGFTILPAELADRNTWAYRTPMPWDLVEQIAKQGSTGTDASPAENLHPASQKIWDQYGLATRVTMLFQDKMIGSDGDLTETRDYNVYVRQMDEIAELKFSDTVSFIQAGRIGDIGCAVGSWIKLAAQEPAFRESDFYGIEVSRFLFELCQQRKLNHDFANPFVFFSQKNAVTGLVFASGSMNTIHTSSLTHEIESYGGRRDLLQFIKNRYAELVTRGVWINRDVVAPFNKDKKVYLQLNTTDGTNGDPFIHFDDKHQLSVYLKSLSTHARFLRFARDFRHKEGYKLAYSTEIINNDEYIALTYRDAAEFLSRKDYTDNWESEMHETFCFWDFDEWKDELRSAGFAIHPSSRVFRNEWIVENRWRGHAALFEQQGDQLVAIEYPDTTMILVAIRER